MTMYEHLARFVALEATEENNTERVAALEAAVRPVRDGALPLQTLVLALGPHLTASDEVVRERATVALAHAVAASPKLPAENAANIATFFASRIESDSQAALPCLRGMLTLLEAHPLTDETIAMVFMAALGTLPVQAWPQPLRDVAYRIAQSCFSQHASAMPAPTSANLFRDAMTGEKDPRCLVVCLDCCRLIVANATLGGPSLCEEVFDATSAYFPVTFRPPPGDTHGITHEMVVDALNGVFAASEHMSDLVLPLLLEKLNLDSDDASLARIEALHCLVTVTPVYGAVGVSPYLDALRAALFPLVSRGAEETEGALEAVKSLVRALSPLAETDENNELWADFTLALLRECAASLGSTMDSMTARASARVMVAVAKASVQGQAVVLQSIVPLLCRRLQDEPSPAARAAGLELLLGVVETVPVGLQVAGQWPLAPYVDMLGSAAESLLGPASALQNGLQMVEARLCVKLLGLLGKQSPLVHSTLEAALSARGAPGAGHVVVACVQATRVLGLSQSDCSLRAAVALSCCLPRVCEDTIPRLLAASDVHTLAILIKSAPAFALEQAIVDKPEALGKLRALDQTLLCTLNQRISAEANARLVAAAGDCASVLLTARKVNLAQMLPLALDMPPVVAASLINKADAGPELDAAVNSLINSNRTDFGLLFKALAMRRHAQADTLGERLLSIDSLAIARALEDGPTGLDRASFAKQSPIYRQRLVDKYLPLLPPSAVALLVGRAPAALLQGKPVVDKVVLAARSLDPNVLDALAVLASLDVGLLEPHLRTLVDFLLAAANTRPAEQRERALDVLAMLTALDYHLVHPVRARVMHGLATALDDPRRSVRSSAVRCKEKWAVFSGQ